MKRPGKTTRLIIACRAALRDGRRVHVVAHSQGQAEAIAARIMAKIGPEVEPGLLSYGGRLAIPEELPPGTLLSVDHHVSEMALEGQRGALERTVFVRAWEAWNLSLGSGLQNLRDHADDDGEKEDSGEPEPGESPDGDDSPDD